MLQILAAFGGSLLAGFLGNFIFYFVSPPLRRVRDAIYLRVPNESKPAGKGGVKEPAAEDGKVSVEVLNGILYQGNRTYNPGDKLELDIASAEKLIKGGFLKRV